jgi:hypothetical protein
LELQSKNCFCQLSTDEKDLCDDDDQNEKKNGNYREEEFEFIWGVAFAAHIAHYTMV